MEWTEEDRKALLSFKNSIENDDIRIKEKIKKILLNNRFIIHVLNNKELEEADSEADDYFGVNILPYYIITPSQTKTDNFICYEITYDELARYNSTVKLLNVIFYILSEQKSLIDSETGIARHDLLAALVQNEFNYTNYFGGKLELISDVASVVDSKYACRTLTFKQTTDNNVVKVRNGKPNMINKDIHTIG